MSAAEDRRLGEAETRGGAADMGLVEQRVEDDEEIEID